MIKSSKSKDLDGLNRTMRIKNIGNCDQWKELMKVVKDLCNLEPKKKIECVHYLTCFSYLNFIIPLNYIYSLL